LESEWGSGLYYLGLVVLILLLCLYLVLSNRETRRLRRRLLLTREEIREMFLDLEGLRSLFRVTASINAQMDLSALLRMIVREAVTVLRADQSSLMLLDRSRTVLKTVAVYGREVEAMARARVRLGEGVAGWVAQHGKPRLLHGRLGPNDFPGLIQKERSIASAACVPLRVRGKTLGVLNVNLLDSDRQFTDNELRLLLIYANHASVAIRNAALFRETRGKARLRSILEGYVSPQVVDILMRNPEGWMTVGEMRRVTVLFADIRGFTKVVQEAGPERTRGFLNQVFTRMSDILFAHQGTLDKFIGDSVMALFGAPLEVKDPELRAVNAAQAMVDAFEGILREWKPKDPRFGELSLGVGISCGDLFVGNVGSERRFDYTAIGQEVNVAKRLCDRARGGQILLSEPVRLRLPKGISLRRLQPVRIQGMPNLVQTYEVLRGPHMDRGSSQGSLEKASGPRSTK
jgi:adenylate cyclase